MLMIFVRHTKACLGNPAKNIPGLLSKGLSPEKLRQYKHCSCPKWYRGTQEGKTYPRMALNANSWEAAERALEKIKTGDRPEVSGVSMEKAVAAWIEEVTLNHAASGTLAQWRSFTGKLLNFCERKKIRAVQNLDPTAINQWRGEWVHEKGRHGIGIKPNTARGRITVLKLFFKFTRRMRWIKEDPMSLIKIIAPKDEDEECQTLPLDEEGDANYRGLLRAIPEFIEGMRGCSFRPAAWKPAHLSALTELMYETGLRISDAFAFEIGRMEVDRQDGWGSYTTKQIKTKKKVTVAVPPELVQKLLKAPRISQQYIFWDGITSPGKVYRCQIWPQLNGAGKLAGIKDMRPHRLRDSFAVNRLNEGMAMQDVSRLLGHASIATTERYYAPFVKSRKDALIAKRKALATPAPVLVPAKITPIRKHA